MNISSSTSYANSAAQEAKETPAQTKAEAAKGDQQAIRRLAQTQSTASAPAPATDTDSDGDTDSSTTVDSDKGQLNAKA